MRSDRERLLDVLDACRQIRKYVAHGESAFRSDELIQNWMIRHLQIIGEAVARISPEFRDDHPGIPWKGMIGMRNILVHDYMGIDLDAVWRAASTDMEALERATSEILGEDAY